MLGCKVSLSLSLTRQCVVLTESLLDVNKTSLSLSLSRARWQGRVRELTPSTVLYLR